VLDAYFNITPGAVDAGTSNGTSDTTTSTSFDIEKLYDEIFKITELTDQLLLSTQLSQDFRKYRPGILPDTAKFVKTVGRIIAPAATSLSPGVVDRNPTLGLFI